MNSLKVVHAIAPLRWLIRQMYRDRQPADERDCLGLRFPNAIGLAAGFDKDARYMHELASLGFGHIEVGTVTPRPQVGNVKPRLFRLVKDEALINRMGFNNRGLEAMVEKLKHRPKDVIIGGNIGKNKDTPNEEAYTDYLTCFKALEPYVDYFVVNVSSPNTPGLRELQEKEPLKKILMSLKAAGAEQAYDRPILLKIAPDLNEAQLDDIVDIVVGSGIAGVISSNTTIAREPLSTDKAAVEAIGNGGLSGRPIIERSNDVLAYLSKQAAGRFTIIGVGGVRDLETAQAKLERGADLIQVYSGFIFEGPKLIKRIVRGLRDSQG